MPISVREFSNIVTSLRDKCYTTLPEMDTKEATGARLALIDPTALELEEVETLLLTVQESQSLLTATGVDLDLLAFNYNVYRRSGQKASGYVQFYIPQSLLTTPISIPKGTVVVSTGTISYETLLDATLNGFLQSSTRNSIPVYEVTVPVACTVTGSGGNSSVNTLTSVDIVNVSVTNNAPIEGGYENEPDDSLATRAILSFGVWSRGTKQAVEFGARLIPGVYYARAITDYAGHFVVYVSDQAGNLSEEMQQAVFDIMVDWAGSGNGWTIVAPPLFLQNISVKVYFKSSVNISTQESQLQADIATIINASSTETIYLDDLITSIKEKTQSYVAHFDLDSPNEHVVKPEGTIIRSGVITVTTLNS